MSIYQELSQKQKAISVVGLGYVGLPLALVLARKFKVVGFDINSERVDMMRNHIDPSKELDSSAFAGTDITFTSDPADLAKAHFHIVAVPTPVDEHRVPNLRPLESASKTVGKALKRGDYVVYESTVYPGCTEEDCMPILEKESGLKFGEDFKLGYSPERINPGDKEHTVEKILKIVSGSDDEALEEVAKVYGEVITAGIFKAATIKVAEAAKVIENTQRDLNIAFMNELSMIFDMMDIDTKSVLEAAGTKWNFLKFSPGLVGGHCIGVDPYYLLHKANKLDYNAQVITSGRKTNDEMPAFIAKRLVKMLIKAGKNPGECRALVMGITFKEDVSDIRNSKVADLINELQSFSINVDVIDPHAAPDEVEHEYGLKLADEVGENYDAVIVAVSHKEYRSMSLDQFRSLMNEQPILMDLKGLFVRPKTDIGMEYWRL